MVTKFWAGFLILLSILCLAKRQQYEGNGSVFVLMVLTDHYLIIFLMTPVFLHCISQIYREPHMVELIRVRKFYRVILAKWMAVVIFSVLFVVSIITVASLMTIGLDFHSNWVGTISNDLKTYLMETFRSPKDGIVLTMSFTILGYSFVGCTFVTAAHYFSRKGTYAIVVASYLVMIISFKMPWMDILKQISMSRIIILHHNFTGSFTWQETLFIMITGILLQIVIMKKWWYVGELKRGRSLVLRKGLFRYYGRILFAKDPMIIWLAGLILLVAMKASDREETLQYFIVRLFYGYRIGDIHPFTWLEQLIYVGIPVYLFATFMQSWLVKRDWQLYIRTRYKRRWIQAILLLMGLYAFSYVLLTFLLIFGATVLFDKVFVIDGGQLAYLLSMKTLEIVLLLGLLFLLFVMTNKVILSFLFIMGLYVINYLPFEWTSYNVAGIGQLARIEEMNQSMLGMIAVGFSYLVVLMISISCTYKRYFVGR